jgi:hypothetical protein
LSPNKLLAIITMLMFSPALVAQEVEVVLITPPFELSDPTEVALVPRQITNQTNGERSVTIQALDRSGGVLEKPRASSRRARHGTVCCGG